MMLTKSDRLPHADMEDNILFAQMGMSLLTIPVRFSRLETSGITMIHVL